MGGPSSEHEVSLSSGRQVVENLDKNKYEVRGVVIPKKGYWGLPSRTDIVFIALHGSFGEDGTIQGFLQAQVHGVRYTGSGVLASALAMDKLKSTEFFRYHGLLTPKQLSFSRQEFEVHSQRIFLRIKKAIGFPCVIKPRSSGSSVGVSVVKSGSGLLGALKLALEEGGWVLAEEFIKGTEVTCGVLDEGTGRNAFALPPLEIIPQKGDFYNHQSKYTEGGSEHIAPRLTPKIIKDVQNTALKAHLVLECSGMSRTDMIISEDKVYVLETNTIPGMTKTSLLPHAAQMTGISFPSLLDRIIKATLSK